jgi:hypothetical protein
MYTRGQSLAEAENGLWIKNFNTHYLRYTPGQIWSHLCIHWYAPKRRWYPQCTYVDLTTRTKYSKCEEQVFFLVYKLVLCLRHLYSEAFSALAMYVCIFTGARGAWSVHDQCMIRCIVTGTHGAWCWTCRGRSPSWTRTRTASTRAPHSNATSCCTDSGSRCRPGADFMNRFRP